MKWEPTREWNGAETVGHQSTPFCLRLDWIATREGVRGGLKPQTTEWIPIESKDWNSAKDEAKEEFRKSIPWDRLTPSILQGGVLVEMEGRRYCTFTFTR